MLAAALLLWMLDASLNIAMEPFRAFVGDMLDPAQHTAGYAMQTAFIGAGAVIERSIIAAGATIGPRCVIRDAVIGEGADVGARCELISGARVWPGVVLPDGGVRFSTDV